MYWNHILGWMSLLLYVSVAQAQSQFEMDQEAVRDVEPGFLAVAADRLLMDSSDFTPRLVRTPNGIGADMAFPAIPERNYATECIKHLAAAKAMEREVLRFSREVGLGPPPTTHEFRSIQGDVLRGFAEDQQALLRGERPNFDRLNSFTQRNRQNFDRCSRDMANAIARPFLGYRDRPRPDGTSSAPRNYNNRLSDAPTYATRSDHITMKPPQGIRSVEFVTELERMLNEHRQIPQERWRWKATTIDPSGNPAASLTIGATYFFRLDHNPAKCHSILISSKSLRFPSS
jgi:hypothetical protein